MFGSQDLLELPCSLGRRELHLLFTDCMPHSHLASGGEADGDIAQSAVSVLRQVIDSELSFVRMICKLAGA